MCFWVWWINIHEDMCISGVNKFTCGCVGFEANDLTYMWMSEFQKPIYYLTSEANEFTNYCAFRGKNYWLTCGVVDVCFWGQWIKIHVDMNVSSTAVHCLKLDGSFSFLWIICKLDVWHKHQLCLFYKTVVFSLQQYSPLEYCCWSILLSV